MEESRVKFMVEQWWMVDICLEGKGKDICIRY